MPQDNVFRTIYLHPGQQLELDRSHATVKVSTNDLLTLDKPREFLGTIKDFPDYENVQTNEGVGLPNDRIALPSIGPGIAFKVGSGFVPPRR